MAATQTLQERGNRSKCDSMSEPPKLDYWAGSAKPRPTKGQRVIGLLGFLAYCLPAFLFDLIFIRLAYLEVFFRVTIVRFPLGMLETTGAVGAFCTWRAIAALIQCIR
jgi:hypothetical protein